MGKAVLYVRTRPPTTYALVLALAAAFFLAFCASARLLCLEQLLRQQRSQSAGVTVGEGIFYY